MNCKKVSGKCELQKWMYCRGSPCKNKATRQVKTVIGEGVAATLALCEFDSGWVCAWDARMMAEASKPTREDEVKILKEVRFVLGGWIEALDSNWVRAITLEGNKRLTRVKEEMADQRNQVIATLEGLTK